MFSPVISGSYLLLESEVFDSESNRRPLTSQELWVTNDDKKQTNRLESKDDVQVFGEALEG